MPTADFDRHERALLAPSGDRSLYVEHALGQRQHKELRRHWRRLSETGAVLFTAATEPAAVAAAMEDFFALEASGWKGRAGTATADSTDLNTFIRSGCHRARRGRQGLDRPHIGRWARHRRDHHFAQRALRLVLEDRLR